MGKDEVEIVGDKLRRALVGVWLANKYDKDISTAKIGNIIGDDSSGLYSAIEHGWFKEEKGKLILTDRAMSYLQTKLLVSHKVIRRFFCVIAIFPLLNLLDWIMLTWFGINLLHDPLSSLSSVILLLLAAVGWYRIYWWQMKRKIST